MALTLARKIALLSPLLLLQIVVASAFADPDDSLSKFVGTWMGTCQDGRMFIVLTFAAEAGPTGWHGEYRKHAWRR